MALLTVQKLEGRRIEERVYSLMKKRCRREKQRSRSCDNIMWRCVLPASAYYSSQCFILISLWKRMQSHHSSWSFLVFPDLKSVCISLKSPMKSFLVSLFLLFPLLFMWFFIVPALCYSKGSSEDNTLVALQGWFLFIIQV